MFSRTATATLAAVAAILVTACAPAANSATATPNQTANALANGALKAAFADTGSISLQRTGCYGICPAYAVSISSKGQVQFDGRSNTRTEGAAKSAISPDSARVLFGDLTDRGFFALSDRYASGTEGCRMFRTDAPVVLLTVTAGKATKTVLWETGCQDAPAILGWLSGRIDSITSVRQWLTP